MTKKRVFVLLAVVVIMALCVCSLVACKNPADNVDNNGGNLVENQKPATGETITDDKKNPSKGMEYALTGDGQGYILTGIGNCKDTKLIIPDVYSPDDKKETELPVVAIGDNALAETNESKRKTNVTVKGNNLVTIGEGAFRNNNALAEIVLPETVKTIGRSAFRGCEALAAFDFPTEVTSVGDGAFNNCSKIAEIKLPDGVTEISNQMFINCKSLKTVLLSTKTTSIGEGAFRGCSNLIIVTLPEEKPEGKEEGDVKNVFPSTLKNIGKQAFTDCSKLEKTITLPDAMTVVNEEIFYGCSKLKEVVIGKDVKTIESKAFYNCTSLESVDLPEGLIEIKDAAFEGTKSLKEIVFNFRLTTIGDNAFRKSGLVDIKFTTGISYIGKFAFSFCENLKHVTFPATLRIIDEGAFMFSGVLPKSTNDDGEEIVAESGRSIEFLYSGTSSDWATQVKKYAITDPSAAYNFWGDKDSKFVIKCSDSDVDLVYDSIIQN